MKNSKWVKYATRETRKAIRRRLRERDRHDRAYVLAFMREAILFLAREDVGVDRKVIHLAAVARRLAPSIMAERTQAAERRGTER